MGLWVFTSPENGAPLHLRCPRALFSHNSDSRRFGYRDVVELFWLPMRESKLNYDKYRWGWLVGVGLMGWLGAIAPARF